MHCKKMYKNRFTAWLCLLSYVFAYTDEDVDVAKKPFYNFSDLCLRSMMLSAVQIGLSHSTSHSLSCTRTHTHAHTHTRMYTFSLTHTHTHTQSLYPSPSLSISLYPSQGVIVCSGSLGFVSFIF